MSERIIGFLNRDEIRKLMDDAPIKDELDKKEK